MSDDLAEWDPPSELQAIVADWSAEELPKLDKSAQRLMMKLRRLADSPPLNELIQAFKAETSLSLAPEGPVVSDRPSGLKRVGVTIQWQCPELGTRLAVGLETALAHRVIDRVLGHERTDAQRLLPTTPVEWGFWTVLAAKLTESLNHAQYLPRLMLDRVGPDPFDLTGLGDCFTVAWELLHRDEPVGVIRVWAPGTLLAIDEPLGAKSRPLKGLGIIEQSFGELRVVGRVQAGVLSLEGGLGRLRPKLVLPWPDAPLAGTMPNLEGPVICRLGQGDSRWSFPARLLPEPQVRIELIQKPKPTPAPKLATYVRGSLMSADSAASPDLPVNLTVELGRLSLSLAKLADLKPGDILELARTRREPLELTSGDRLVARAELVQIDQELGLRILQVLL